MIQFWNQKSTEYVRDEHVQIGWDPISQVAASAGRTLPASGPGPVPGPRRTSVGTRTWDSEAGYPQLLNLAQMNNILAEIGRYPTPKKSGLVILGQ